MMKTLISLALTLLVSGCASNGLTDKQKSENFQAYVAQQNLTELDRITSFKFHGWTSLNNDHLIIRTSPSKRYLVALRSSCYDLKFAHGIIINRSSSTTLSAKFDSISIPEFSEYKCFIKSIYEVTDEQVAEIKALTKPQDESA